MSGIQTEFLLGVFFTVVGLAELVMPASAPKNGAIVKFVAGLALLLLVWLKVSMLGV